MIKYKINKNIKFYANIYYILGFLYIYINKINVLESHWNRDLEITKNMEKNLLVWENIYFENLFTRIKIKY